MSLLIFSLLALAAVANGQILKLGSCPDIPVMQDFAPDKYTGIWYEYERYFAIFELFGTCTYANYTLKPNGRINVLNQGVNRFTKTESVAHGEAYAPDSNVPSKLLVKFDKSPAKPGPYWVLDTDFDNYSIVYSCSDVTSFARTEIVWILARRREGPPTALIQKAEGLLKQLGVSTFFLMKTKQDNCSN